MRACCGKDGSTRDECSEATAGAAAAKAGWLAYARPVDWWRRNRAGCRCCDPEVNDTTGAFIASKAEAWLKRNSALLGEFPELAREFRSTAAAQRAVDELAASQKAERDAFNKSAMRHFLDPDLDTGTALDRLFRRRVGHNPIASMRELVQSMQRDPAALNGLRRSVVEWLADRGLPGAEKAIKGPHPLEKLVADNRDTLRQVFTDPELNRPSELGRDVGWMRAESARVGRTRATIWRLFLKAGAGALGFHFGELPGALAGVLTEHGVEPLLGGAHAFADGAAQERLIAAAMHDPEVFAALTAGVDAEKPAALSAAGLRLARALPSLGGAGRHDAAGATGPAPGLRAWRGGVRSHAGDEQHDERPGQARFGPARDNEAAENGRRRHAAGVELEVRGAPAMEEVTITLSSDKPKEANPPSTEDEDVERCSAVFEVACIRGEWLTLSSRRGHLASPQT